MHYVRGQRDDWHPLLRTLLSFESSNSSGGFEPVHNGHLHVHQDGVENGSAASIERLSPIVRHDNGVPMFLEQTQSNMLVHTIVFG
jgi:hypothetical protein